MMKRKQAISGLIVLGVVAIVLSVSGCTNLPSSECRDFYKDMSGDIGEASTFDGSDCSVDIMEDCYVLDAHWENIDSLHMEGSYRLHCRCCPLIGGG